MKNNKKAFTLIELLAVLVILGVLIGIAIPKVTQYINKSKKDGFVSTGSFFVETMKSDFTSEFYPLPIRNNDVTIVTFDLANLDNKDKKSAFGGTYVNNKSYVAVVNVGTGVDPEYKYYVAMQDSKGYAFPLTNISSLTTDRIIANAKNKMEITIQPLCGTKDGYQKEYTEISGLNDVQPRDELGNKINWKATIYSGEGCTGINE